MSSKLLPLSGELQQQLQLARRALAYADKRLAIMSASLPINGCEMPHLAATSKGMQVFINEERWHKATDGWALPRKALGLAFVVFHEYMHHVLRFWLVLSMGDYNPQVLNIAQDLVINQLAEVAFGPQMPDILKDLKVVRYQDFGFPAGLSTLRYYELLMQQAKSAGRDADSIDGGSMGGCAAPAEGDGPEGDPSDDKSRMEQEQIIRQGQGIVDSMSDKAKSRGYDPSGFKIDLSLVDLRYRIDWRSELRELVGYSINTISGSNHPNWALPSRRSAAVGYGVMHAVIPATRDYSPRIAVILDTSGSMQDWIAEAVTHIWTLLECYANVHFIACDADVHASERIKTLEELLDNIKGGGGTNMRPALNHLANDSEPPDVCICVTDGEIGDIGTEPDWTQIWVSNNDDFAPAWGKTIIVKDINTNANANR